MSKKSYEIDYVKDSKDEKSGSLGKTLLKILGIGVIAGAALIGSAEKLGEEVLHDEEYEEREAKHAAKETDEESLVQEIKE